MAYWIRPGLSQIRPGYPSLLPDVVAYMARPGCSPGPGQPQLLEEDVEVARTDRLARVCRKYRGQTNSKIVYDR